MQRGEDERGCLTGRSRHPTGGGVTSIEEVSAPFLTSQRGSFQNGTQATEIGDSDFSFFLQPTARRHISPSPNTAGVSFCPGGENQQAASVCCAAVSTPAQVNAAASKQHPRGSTRPLQPQRLLTYLMDLEENLIEVVCCFSLSPVGAADLRKQSIKRRESRSAAAAALQQAAPTWTQMQMRAAGRQAGKLSGRRRRLADGRSTKKRRGGRGVYIREEQQHHGQTQRDDGSVGRVWESTGNVIVVAAAAQ